jgi:hypothetical protein
MKRFAYFVNPYFSCAVVFDGPKLPANYLISLPFQRGGEL